MGMFVLSGSYAGLFAGFFEAALLYFVPRPAGLLKPDIGTCIWLLAPLIDLLVFGLIGLALGIVAGVWKPVTSWRIAILAGVGSATVSTFLITEALWFRFQGNRYLLARQKIALTLLVLGLLSGLALILLKLSWNRVEHYFDPETQWPWKPLMNRVFLIAGGLASGLAYSAYPVLVSTPARAVASRRSSKPNLILISLDTVRADHLSSYRYPRATTPNLDRLASQGVLFENAVAPSSWTLPSMSSVLTGLLPYQRGADSSAPLAIGSLTLPQLIKSRGYETAGFNANMTYGLVGWGLGQGFNVYDDNSSSLLHNLKVTRAGQQFGNLFYSRFVSLQPLDRQNARELNGKVLHWFSGHSSRPFFLFINYMDAHGPYLAPPPYDQRFGRTSEALLRRIGRTSRENLLPQAERTSLLTGYDNCLAFIDSQLGELLGFLKNTSDWANTIIVITSDHGEAFGEKGHYGHGGTLDWVLLHVPLIALGPGIPEGLRNSQVVSTLDIFPTLLGLAAGPDDAFTRRGLSRFWNPTLPASPRHDEAAISEVTLATNRIPVTSISLLTPEWHYIHHTDGTSELYDWRSDEGEKSNLYGSSRYDTLAQSLRQQLRAVVGTSAHAWKEGDQPISPEANETLRTLPYH